MKNTKDPQSFDGGETGGRENSVPGADSSGDTSWNRDTGVWHSDTHEGAVEAEGARWRGRPIAAGAALGVNEARRRGAQ